MNHQQVDEVIDGSTPKSSYTLTYKCILVNRGHKLSFQKPQITQCNFKNFFLLPKSQLNYYTSSKLAFKMKWHGHKGWLLRGTGAVSLFWFLP